MPDLKLNQLHDDPRNANVCSTETLNKIRRNIERSGFYPPLIVRPFPGKKDQYIILDGHHRKQILLQLGYKEAECQVWDVDEQGAQLALATLNRLRGEDEPRKRAELLQSMVHTIPLPDLVQFVPESEKGIGDLLALLTLDWEEAEAKIKKQMEREQENLPVPFACMLASSDYPQVERALSRFEGNEQEENLIHLPLASQYSRLLLQLDFIFKQAIHLEDLELTRRIAVDRARLLIQQRKELMNDTNLLHQSRLVGSDELEEIIRSLESEGKNYPD